MRSTSGHRPRHRGASGHRPSRRASLASCRWSLSRMAPIAGCELEPLDQRPGRHRPSSCSADYLRDAGVGGPGRRRVSQATSSSSRQGTAPRYFGDQWCRVRTLHHLRRHADAHARPPTSLKGISDHAARACSAPGRADRHRGQQARSPRRRCRPPSRPAAIRRASRPVAVPTRYPGRRRQAAHPRAHRHRESPMGVAATRFRRAVFQRRHRLQPFIEALEHVPATGLAARSPWPAT
jgi:hypothetical protein